MKLTYSARLVHHSAKSVSQFHDLKQEASILALHCIKHN